MPNRPPPVRGIPHCQIENGDRKESSTSGISIDPTCKPIGNIGHITRRRSVAIAQITVWGDRTGVVNASGGIDVSGLVDALSKAITMRGTLCSVLHHTKNAVSLIFRVE